MEFGMVEALRALLANTWALDARTGGGGGGGGTASR